MKPVSWEHFEELVEAGLALVPDEFAELAENVAITMADRHPDEPTLLGLYVGTPLTERVDYGAPMADGQMVMPDEITLYRLALCDFCRHDEELVEEVAVTVVHELAHHFGIDDDRLHELGWG